MRALDHEVDDDGENDDGEDDVFWQGGAHWRMSWGVYILRICFII